jgi:hypothetical protein
MGNQKDVAMNAENPVQIDLVGVSATRTKDTRLADHEAVPACPGRPGRSQRVTVTAKAPVTG